MTLVFCFAGPKAQKWHPGLGAEIGYLYMSRDFLNASETKNQGGFLFGGDWYFPLRILSNGSVVAKLSYPPQSGAKNK